MAYGSCRSWPTCSSTTRRRRSPQRAVDEFGRLDILVNNVGGSGDPIRLQKLTPDDWAAGLRAQLLLVGADDDGLPADHARARAGAASSASRRRTASSRVSYFGPYSAAKAALLNYSKNLSKAFSAQGVLANCVIPGVTITEAINDTARVGRGGPGRRPPTR